MYGVFTKLDEGEYLFIAFCEELKQAAQLVKKFNENVPHEYVVRDSKGNNIDLKE
jgi:hypothetical protein